MNPGQSPASSALPARQTALPEPASSPTTDTQTEQQIVRQYSATIISRDGRMPTSTSEGYSWC